MATNRQRRQSAAKRAKRLGGTILPLALALIAGPAAASHAPPAITDPAPDAFVATGIVTVAGTAPGDAVAVRVFEGATLLADTGTLNGFWSVDVAFADGAHTITAKARDSGGGLSVASTPVTFTVDTIAPAPPVIASPPPGAVLAFSAVTVEGTAEPGARIEVASDVGATWTATASGTGAWLATRTVADATYTIRATATDRAGNTSLASPSRTFRVDTLAPQPPEILTPRPGSFTNLPAVQITGSSEPGSTVRVSEGAVIGTVVAAPGGTWSLAVTFADGPHTITARATDAAGHVSARSDAVTFTVDTVAPPVPTIASPAQGSLVGGRVTFTGGAEPLATVELLRGTGVLASTTASGGGSWSISLDLVSGPQSFRARARDRAGNASAPTAPREFTVDAIPPSVQIDTAPNTLFLPTQSPRVEGRAQDNLGVLAIELQYYDLLGRHVATVNAVCQQCPFGTDVDWYSQFALPTGRYHVIAYAIDRVGNRSLKAETAIVRI